MRKLFKMTVIAVLSVGLIACEKDEDDDTKPASSTNNNTNETAENNLLRVYFQNTASGTSEFQWGRRVICYTDSSCSTNNSGSFRSTSTNYALLTSDKDKNAVGVEIQRIEVTRGSGKVIVINGRYKESDEFVGDDTLFTSEEINGQTIYNLEYGTIEF